MTEPMAKPLQFLQDVRQEAGKVTWPARQETLITTGLVILMCVFASLFLFVADQVIHSFILFILALGH